MKAIEGLRRSLILLNIILVVSFIQTSVSQVLSIQRCGDPQCQGPISEGRTVLKYHANSNSMLSFTTNQPVLIFSKGEGGQSDIWGVEINGKRGFVNRRHIQETRVGVRNLGYVAPPHHTYYEMQLGGPDAAAHMQRQQQMQGQEGPEVAAHQHHHHQHHHHNHNHQHQEQEQQPHVLPNVPHPSAQQEQQQPPPNQRRLLSEDPNISQPQNDLKQPASEPKVENVEPALFQPEANLQQQQQPNMVDSTGASQEGSSSMAMTSSEVTGTGNDVTKPALPASPEDPASDQNIAMQPKISESDTHLAENEETAQKLLDEPE